MLADPHDQLAGHSFPAGPDVELNDAALVPDTDLHGGLSFKNEAHLVTESQRMLADPAISSQVSVTVLPSFAHATRETTQG
ncbi:hypothetical protein AUT26_18830 [[Arthrobacter] sp. ATCC 21022]|nr:hypothetical protein AUT26_18830 [Arthrobacter sp. ATCC 21022]